MSLLVDKWTERTQLRQQTQCHRCQTACRYIYKEQVWCRECLDKEQYPQLAHLTQEEREEKRKVVIHEEKKVNLVNTTNLGRIGF